jgi:hypothetical protein
MAVRLFPREHVEQELWKRNCRKLKDYETAALWTTRDGFHFTVPQEPPDGRCDEYMLREILDDLDRRSSTEFWK